MAVERFSKTSLKLFHVIATALMTLLWGVAASMPPNPHLKFNPLGLVFLTSQVNLLIYIYFVAETCADFKLLPSVLTHWSRHASNFVFTMACTIGILYYALVHFTDPVQQRCVEEANFCNIMHLLHAMPLALLSMDWYLLASHHSHAPDKVLTQKLVLAHAIIYTLWSMFAHWMNERWPYPHQQELSYATNVLVGVGLSIVMLGWASAACHVSDHLATPRVSSKKHK